MIEINSDCSRVDFVSMLASQIKLQLAQGPHSIPADENQRRLQAKIDAVDEAVKSGNPQKAELALASAQYAATEILAQSRSASPVSSQGVNAYA